MRPYCLIALLFDLSFWVLKMSFGGLVSRRIVGLCLACFLLGCSSGEAPSYQLDPELARASVEKAMQAWKDGKTPKDIQSEMIVGDPDWTQGKKLVSFEILPKEETTDGSNLYIRVKRKIGSAESQITYVVGTNPAVTIFPQ